MVLTSKTKNTKNTYAKKKMGPKIFCAFSMAMKSKSPRMVLIKVKAESVKLLKSSIYKVIEKKYGILTYVCNVNNEWIWTWITYLCSKEQVSQLRKSKENKEEHDSKSCHVAWAPAEGASQLSHGFVEADILEQLDQGKEDTETQGHSGLDSPGEEFKVRLIRIWIGLHCFYIVPESNIWEVVESVRISQNDFQSADDIKVGVNFVHNTNDWYLKQSK